MNLGEFRAKWDRLIESSDPTLQSVDLATTQPTDLLYTALPNAAQLDLLRAALLPPEQAGPAWRSWKERDRPLETVDGASARMFPQLWANRVAAGIDTDDISLLKTVYRQTLGRNTVILKAALEAAQVLTDADVPVLFIKGAAMIAMSNGSLGLRPIADVDVLVPEADAERAVTLLMAAGYMAESYPPIGVSHGFTLKRPDGSQLDLHWWAFKTAGDDRPMFDTAREATILNRRVLIPNATDCLAMAVANAFRRSGSPLRWISDAVLIFETDADALDWNVLLERARRPGLRPGLATGLDFLAREFAAPVPPFVLSALREHPVSWRERAAHWAAMTKPGSSNVLEQLELQRARHLYYRIPWSRHFLDSSKIALQGFRAFLREVVVRSMRQVRAIRNPGFQIR
jgi:hypothetical protein